MPLCFILCAEVVGRVSAADANAAVGLLLGWFHEFSFFFLKKKKGVWQLVTLFSFACISSFGLLQKRKTARILLASLQASAQDFTLGVQDLILGFARVSRLKGLYSRYAVGSSDSRSNVDPTASAARLNIFSDPILVAEVRSDMSWRTKLRVQQRLMGDAKIGFPFSMIVTPPMVVESSCSLVFYCVASRHGLGAFMEGAPGTFGPMPRC
jgi:hypothetical protein